MMRYQRVWMTAGVTAIWTNRREEPRGPLIGPKQGGSPAAFEQQVLFGSIQK